MFNFARGNNLGLGEIAGNYIVYKLAVSNSKNQSAGGNPL
jgi:hypothetical protein